MKKVMLLTIVLLVTMVINVSAQENEANLQMDDMFEMSLEDLMNLEVKVGTISGTSNMKLPLSVTTITEEEIELSNAQNILHLLQVYVPGASFWRHNEGAMLGLRGITSDRNDKILLLVNGFVVNQKAHAGIVSELQNWDMEDIKKVEIIRGPGSVTYGPGAIAGVINIITKSAGDLDGFKASASYASAYNNKTVTTSYGFEKEKLSGYFHASVASTEGMTPDGQWMTKIGDDYSIAPRGDATNLPDAYAAPALTYAKDFENKPQLKFLGSINFLNEFTFNARYNRTAFSAPGYAYTQGQKVIGYDDQGDAIWSAYEDRMFQSQQQLIVSLKNNHKFGEVDLQTEVAFVGGDYQRTNADGKRYLQEDYETLSKDFDVNSYDFIFNNRSKFSENSFVAKSMGVHKINDKYKVAAGVEYIRTRFGKGWGDDARNLKMANNPVFLNGPDSYLVHDDLVAPVWRYGYKHPDTSVEGEDVLYVGDGWSTDDLGFVAEANLEFSSLASVVLSARLDKNTYSDWLFSPRVAFISEINKSNIAKLIFQQSKRINNAEVNYLSNFLDAANTQESISNIELIYTSLLGDHSMLNVAGYYNNQEALGWNSSINGTSKVADLKMAGFEVEYKLQYNNLRAGINHSFNKLLDYELADGVNETILSYSDYLIPTETGTINVGNGDDLRNMPNNMSKMYLDRYFKNKKYVFHTEFAVVWGYPGDKDAQNVAASMQESQAEAIAIYDLYQTAFDDHNMFGNNYFWNATVSGKIFEGALLTVGVNNILGGESTKSYNLSRAKSTSWDPTLATYFVQPRSYTVKLRYEF